MNIRFYNALLLTMEEDRPVFEGEVWVRDERIFYVGDGRDKDLFFARFKEPCMIWDEEIDCQGNLLMPGFKDAHTHSGMTLLRSYADDLPLQSWLNEQVFPIEWDYIHFRDVSDAGKYWTGLHGYGNALCTDGRCQ